MFILRLVNIKNKKIGCYLKVMYKISYMALALLWQARRGRPLSSLHYQFPPSFPLLQSPPGRGCHVS